ncbi:MAG: biotin synthase BioB [Bacteroidetes bacterium]|nr:biotin synthase BioB [Bacteroidota bacterium]
MKISEIKEKILNNQNITREEALELNNIKNKEELYKLANEIREHFNGNDFDTCSIINAKSGKCSEDCKWCSQSVFHKTNADIYPLIDTEKIIDNASYNAKKGIRKVSLVTSGKRISGDDAIQIYEIYKTLKKKVNIGLCASMGLVEKSVLQELKNSGVDNYHCNIETSPKIFKTLCTTHSFDEKIETLKNARAVGMNICSGGIIGMGETFEDRVDMALTLRDLGVTSIPLNILNPIKGTKLENTKPLSDEEVLTTFAMFRLVNPKARIRFAGGRLQIEHIQRKALLGGVNAALMGDLLTTVGSKIDEDKKMIEELGYKM